ncbi:hypothetical protein ACIBEF_17395 [Micromonospora sp. NPDC050795]|uniref:hypothetical protein n=1 Tax=Micromonospora sp. NPDC050795 TaxID=3364282 RepID=UPI0037A49AEB
MNSTVVPATSLTRHDDLPQHVRVARFLVDRHPQRPSETHNVASPRTGRGCHLLDGHPMHARRFAQILTVAEAAGQESHRDPDRLISVNHETTVRSESSAWPSMGWSPATNYVGAQARAIR